MARILSIICLVVLIAPAFAQERTWTSADGTFKVEATFVSATAENVVLKRKSDGKEITVPLAKLSAADRKWVNEESGDAPEPKLDAGLSSTAKTPKFTTTAQELVNEFAADNAKAKSKYTFGTVVRLSGKVDRYFTVVGTDGNMFHRVELKTSGKRKVILACPAWWADFAKSLKPGDRVAVVSEWVSGDGDDAIEVNVPEFVKVK